jgi:eukaryotic-like serine/threonine-protein kinase
MHSNIAEAHHWPATLAVLVDSLKQDWRRGTPPDAVQAIRQHPELLLHRSLAIDLVYEEYCLLEEVGQPPDLEQFCQKLPAFGSYIREVILGHRVLANHPELFAKADIDWPDAGEEFAGLAIVRELGRGTFARAYLALDHDTGNRPVVLKVSPAPSTEARTLGPISHPHIVAIHWARRIRGLNAICMPFVGETTLADAIETVFRGQSPGHTPTSRTILRAIDSATNLPSYAPPLLVLRESYTDAVATIAARLADALAYLHRSGLSHGDLKPSNIIFAPGGHPYLIDFNLSTGPDNSLLRLGGTLPYMAPERIRHILGEPGGPDPTAPTDVYSLGVVLYEVLTGKVPLEPAALADPVQAARDLLRRQLSLIPNVRAETPRVPRSIACLVNCCLVADPLKRLSAESLAKELNRHLRRRVRRHRVFGGGVGLVGIGILAWQFTVATQPAPAALPQPVYTVVHTSPSTREELFKRGVDFMKTGDTAAAMKDFDDARRKQPNGQSTAFLAYCHSRIGNHRAASALYFEAINDATYKKAWVHCNLAYSLIKWRSLEHLRLAIEQADAALAIEPDLRAARLNRVYARYLSGLEVRPQTITEQERCLADLNAVMSDGPYSADLYFKAALILTSIGKGREEHYAQAVAYLQEAVRGGKNPTRLTLEPVFRDHLKGRKDFEQLTNLPPIERLDTASNFHLVDPLNLLTR